MADEGKKISFGFSKLVKKTSIVPSQLTISNTKPEENKIQFIDCLEGKSIKLKDPIKSDNTILVIPLKKRVGPEDVKNSSNPNRPNIGLALDSTLETQNSNNEFETAMPTEPTHLDTKVVENDQINTINGDGALKTELTLEEIAAKEIMDELNKKNTEEETRVFSVPLTTNAPVGEKESTLDDYDNIPVNAFGAAMLRGMGWAPGKGIGKNEKLVAPSMPTLRPKGMGLGADKVIKTAVDNKNPNEDLKMTKGSFVRVIAGNHKDCYGQIEGFDDESGRTIVKLALKSISVSLNEFMVQLVDRLEYTKNSKVINVSKYEKYKDNEEKKDLVRSKLNEDNEHFQETPSLSSRKHKESRPNEKHSDTSSISTIDQSKRKLHSSSESNDYVEVKQEASRKLSPPRKPRERLSKKRSTSGNSSSSPCSDEYKRRDKSKSSESRAKSLSSRHSSTTKRSSHKDHRSKSQQIASTSSDSASEYSREIKHRTKKKKPSSRRPKSRSRSRSPRKHSSGSHKKHKKSKYR